MAHLFVSKPGFASKGYEAASSYSIEDLLIMRRTLPYVICDIKKLELSVTPGLLRVPRQAYTDPRHYNCKSTAIKQIVDSEERPHTPGVNLSSDEEDIVYRGHPLHQNLREYQWRFRREDNADRPTQPISAPTGIEAQKAQNFKKFYQAVVSPTHIRVTAGGRIVPNTRTLPQPVFTWNHKTLRFESNRLNPKDSLPLPQGATIEKAAPSLQLGLPFPQPIRFGGFLQPQASAQPLNVSSQKTAISEVGAFEEVIKSGVFSSMAPDTQISIASDGPPNITPGGVVLSPPTQFDSTKPFIFNGQLVYPMPPGFQVPSNVPVLPFNMLTNATSSHQIFGPPTQAPSTSISPMAMPMAPPMAQFPGHTTGYLPVNIAALNLPANFAPHGWATLDQLIAMGPLPVPDTVGPLKSQIQSLEKQMEFIKQQLEGNENQVDRQQLENHYKGMEVQLHALRTTLSKLTEANLPQTASQLLTSAAQSEIHLTTSKPLRKISVKPSAADKIAEQTVIRLTSMKGDERSPKNENSIELNSQNVRSLPQKQSAARKRLSAAAAMAPPFQPRSQQVILAQSNGCDTRSSPTTLVKSGNVPLEIQAPGVSKGGNWNAPAPESTSPAGPVTHNLQPSSPTHLSTMLNTQAMSSFAVPGKFNFSVPEVPVSNFSKAIIGDTEPIRPYLTGFSAPGVALDQVDSKDLIYARPLTEEEIRARHLYWGKAPREVSKGLPKFDGRDFYPPTPVKNFAVPVSFKRASHTRQGFDLSASMSHGTFVPVYEPKKQISFSEDSADDPFHEPDNRASTPSNNEKNDLEDDDTETASLDSWGAPKHCLSNMKYFEAEEATKAANITSVKPSKGKDVSIPKLGTFAPDLKSQGNPTFLRSMLKNGSGGGLSYPLGGALSSATAQGYLPHYQGAALASLAPSMKIAQSSAGKFDTGLTQSSAQMFSSGSANLKSGRTSRASVQTENRIPSRMTITSYEEEGAADLLRRIKDQDAAIVHPGWNVNTTGIGPIVGADW